MNVTMDLEEDDVNRKCPMISPSPLCILGGL